MVICNITLVLLSFFIFLFFFYIKKSIVVINQDEIIKQKTKIFILYFLFILIIIILMLVCWNFNKMAFNYSIKSLNFWLFSLQIALNICSFIFFCNLFSNFVNDYINGNIKNPSCKFNQFIKDWSYDNFPLSKEEIVFEIGCNYWQEYQKVEGSFIQIEIDKEKKYCMGHTLLNLANTLELQKSNKLLKKINITIFLVNVFLLAISFCSYLLNLNDNLASINQGISLLIIILIVVVSLIFAFWSIIK